MRWLRAESSLVAAAKARWKANFTSRVALMERLLDKADEDLSPTPKGDGDE